MTNLVPGEESFRFAQTFWPKVSKKVMMSAWAILKFTSWGVTPNIAIVIHHATLCPDFFENILNTRNLITSDVTKTYETEHQKAV